MKISDYLQQSFSNLWKMKLRTFLTTFGVVVGIGALAAMVSFGTGMEKNATESFKSLELFNYITVFPASQNVPFATGREDLSAEESAAAEVLDEAALTAMQKIKGVTAVFPEIRFPAVIKLEEKEEFRLVQVLPAHVAASKLMQFRAGEAYTAEDEDGLILSNFLLKQLGVNDFASALGKRIELSSLAFNFSLFDPADLSSMLSGDKLPFSKEGYVFTIVGIAESMGFGGPTPLRSDVFISPQASQRIKKLPFSNLWDLFRSPGSVQGYSAVNVKISSPAHADPVKERIQKMGFKTFVLLDQLEEIKRVFFYMDMFLAALGMIALFVASLGIINTMVMSILERFSEIGIMKAVGATDRDIRKIFFFETASIGFVGGVFGLALGWIVTRIINTVVNYLTAKQGIPAIEYFSFPLWLCLGAVAFSVLVSLAAGIYPAYRAARVDPIIALRHD